MTTKEDIKILQKANVILYRYKTLNWSEVVTFLNEHNIEYDKKTDRDTVWSDLEMLSYYLENCE